MLLSAFPAISLMCSSPRSALGIADAHLGRSRIGDFRCVGRNRRYRNARHMALRQRVIQRRSAGLTADYRMRGALAVVIGVGWFFAALAAITSLAVPEKLRGSGLAHAITGVALLTFAICLVYVAAKSVLQTYFPGWA